MPTRTLPQVAVEIEALVAGIEEIIKGLDAGAAKTAIADAIAEIRAAIA